MTTSGTVISTYCLVKWNVLDKSYSGYSDQAKAFAHGLLAADDKTQVVFTAVVLARTVLMAASDLKIVKADGQKQVKGLNHSLNLWIGGGPFTAKEFLEMMDFSSDAISSEDSVAFMDRFKRL